MLLAPVGGFGGVPLPLRWLGGRTSPPSSSIALRSKRSDCAGTTRAELLCSFLSTLSCLLPSMGSSNHDYRIPARYLCRVSGAWLVRPSCADVLLCAVRLFYCRCSSAADPPAPWPSDPYFASAHSARPPLPCEASRHQAAEICAPFPHTCRPPCSGETKPLSHH